MQPWVWSVSDFIFLASACEGDWPVLFLTISSSHWQNMVSVLIIAELARGCRCRRNLKPNLCPGWDLNPEMLKWQSSTLTIRPHHTRIPTSISKTSHNWRAGLLVYQFFQLRFLLFLIIFSTPFSFSPQFYAKFLT